MSWKDSAIPVPFSNSRSNWKDTAIPVDMSKSVAGNPPDESLNFERSSSYPPSRMTDATVPDAMVVDAAVKAPMLAFNLAKAGVSGIKNLAGKISSIRNAPQALEEALGAAGEKFGTSATPSMVGFTARAGLESENALNEALAQKLYSNVPKEVTVKTPQLSSTYQEMADELPPSIGNLVKKKIQIEQNPIRTGDIGEFKGTTKQTTPPEYGVGYSASPGSPTQIPEKVSSIEDLIKLRSKLGVAAKSGGIDGYNASKLKSALDQDIANLGSGEGPLGKMTNEVVNENLDKATNYYRELMSQQSTPLYKELSTGKIEDIPDIIFKNGRTQDVLESRAILGDQGFNAAKKSFYNDILNSKSVGKTLEKYSKNNSDFLQSVFNDSELNSLKTIADLQQKAIEAAKTVNRAKILMGVGAAALGGGLAGKATKFGLDSK